jgi:NAD+ kinase
MTGSSTRNMLVISHAARPEAILATRYVIDALRAQNIVPVMTEEDRNDYAPHQNLEHTKQLVTDVALADIEVAIVLGGDGTILRAAEVVRGSRCPIVSVNLGHVGFLAEMEPHDLDSTLERVLHEQYSVEERVTLDVRVLRNGETVAETWAVNEASVEKQQRMIELSIGVDDHPLSTFGCDGVVMASPTGSTAYSFSAGGPVVWPGVNAMLMVPIAAHALFNRPLVVGPESVLEAQLSTDSPGSAFLWCDGRRRVTLEPGTRVEVRKSDEPVRIARLFRGVFAERLVQKFHLPVEGWRQQQ